MQLCLYLLAKHPFFAIMYCLEYRSIGKIETFSCLEAYSLHISVLLQYFALELNFHFTQAELIAGHVTLDFVFLTERNSSNESMQSPQCGDLLHIFCGEG